MAVYFILRHFLNISKVNVLFQTVRPYSILLELLEVSEPFLRLLRPTGNVKWAVC